MVCDRLCLTLIVPCFYARINYIQFKGISRSLRIAKKEDYYMFVLICTLLYTGIRISEALELPWGNVDLDNGVINIKQRLVYKRGTGPIIEELTKTHKSRRAIKISAMMCKILEELKEYQNIYDVEEVEYVFCKPDGEVYYPTSLNKKMKKLITKAELPYNSKIHILRHTFAINGINNGVPPEIIQLMLGHSTISTTIDMYYHGDLDKQEEAANKFDKTYKF
jgi:integrase